MAPPVTQSPGNPVAPSAPGLTKPADSTTPTQSCGIRSFVNEHERKWVRDKARRLGFDQERSDVYARLSYCIRGNMLGHLDADEVYAEVNSLFEYAPDLAKKFKLAPRMTSSPLPGTPTTATPPAPIPPVKTSSIKEHEYATRNEHHILNQYSRAFL